MKILILDGQGGKLGSQLVKTILTRFPQADLTAVGTNAAATSAMVKEKTPCWWPAARQT